MNTIEFDIPMIPTGKGRPRIVRRRNMPYPVAITPEKTVQAENSFLAQAAQHKPAQPWAGPVALTVRAFFPIPASYSKKRTAACLSDEELPAKKPDWDNLGKLLSDAMNGVFYADDAQLVRVLVEKFYDTYGHVSVKLEQVGKEIER